MNRLAIILIRIYQYTLSPIFQLLGARCRFEQSCSQYAVHMLRSEPFWRAIVRIGARLGQCR